MVRRLRCLLGKVNWGYATAIFFALLTWFMAYASAQQPDPRPKLYVFADTAGISGVGDSVYLTWVFAKATPNGLPSSGILVGFDCKNHLVQRYAHVVYHLTPDSTGVTGSIVEDVSGWVPVSVPKLFDMVCEIGPKHGTSSGPTPQVITPKVAKPKSLYPEA